VQSFFIPFLCVSATTTTTTTNSLVVLQFTENIKLAVVNAAVLDHDDWEFHGGRKKRRVHGLNKLIDVSPEKEQSQFVVTNDDGDVVVASSNGLAASSSSNDAEKNRDGNDNNRDTDNELRNRDHFSKKKKDHRSNTQPYRKRNIFRRSFHGGDDENGEIIHALPDRFSVLNFDSSTDFDDKDDDDKDNDQQQDKEGGEKILAQKSWWGRLYLDGFPGPFQYFRAHFGAPPPLLSSSLKFVLADPPTACDSEEFIPVLSNIDQIDEHTIVVVVRGDCTFGEKAIEVHKAGALGVLFINNEVCAGVNRPMTIEKSFFLLNMQ